VSGFIFIKAEYSTFIAFLQFSSPNASFIFCSSPDDVKNPYRIVPSVYTFGLRVSACNRVMGLDISGAFVATAGSAASSSTEDPDAEGELVRSAPELVRSELV
jgi:hypothetical protein